MKIHHYKTIIEWTGNTGSGTSSYDAYKRDFTASVQGKPDIEGSSDPAFLGDASRWNPEDMLLAALSSCHKLWYLHFCANAGVIVSAYTDYAEAEMSEGSRTEPGRFLSVVLRPRITISADSDADIARALCQKAHQACFISNSVNFPVTCEPEIIFE
ncbi:MAG: OsmC family protein [Neisseria sp.]|uniref:OsmC family protein n=1 Tax=Neisseria sp. TaxID=192066 RepID=UPI0026DC2A1D|nr:OsmC family protein [Neisseria sp.]MDO4640750.1 OsmC family protein [Neisseria sp.]